MADLTFSQPERPRILGPVLIALAVVVAAGFAIYRYLPRRVADLSIMHTAVVGTRTVFKTDSKLVGHQDSPEDDLYVLVTLRIDDKLHVPLFISDLTSTFISADDTVFTTSAIEKNDLDQVFTSFPQTKPLAGPPLLRESTILPGGNAEGMVMLHLPLTQADWDKRKSATLTVTFYHQGSYTVTIPK